MRLNYNMSWNQSLNLNSFKLGNRHLEHMAYLIQHHHHLLKRKGKQVKTVPLNLIQTHLELEKTSKHSLLK